jgi:ankyrin repeat protein
VVAAVVAYALSPIDLIPDFVPVLGYLDELILLPLALGVAVRLVPADVLAECRARALEIAERPVSRVAGTVIVVVWLAVAALAAVWIYAAVAAPAPAAAQAAPSAAEIARYAGLLAAAARGDATEIEALIRRGERVDLRDAHGRTALHVAAYGAHHGAMRALVAAGANPNAVDNERYDVVTIAAVANDVPTLRVALALGASARNVTSPYNGTALIAAAHLGHVEVVRTLIRADAPLDHVNNLGWTAVIEAIVLGDGGPRHTETLAALVQAGADVNLPDRGGRTPLALARARGHTAMVRLLERAGAR